MKILTQSRPALLAAFAVVLSSAAAKADILYPAFDSVGRISTATNIDKNYTGNMAVGPVSGTDYFRTYLTFDLTGATTAAGVTSLTLKAGNGGENNTSSVAQVFTLFSLPADWDGTTQPGPGPGTVLATVNFTPTTGNDTQNIIFASTALTDAFNAATGGSLYLGIKSDAEGTAARSFKWFGSTNHSGAEPQLTYTPLDTTPPAILPPTVPAGGDTGVLVSTSLVATFNEPIALEDGGTITIDDLGGTDTVITLPDSQVSVSGSDLVITPASPLAAGTDYAIQISNNAVKDLAPTPNFFIGISDTTTWHFQTAADGTEPGLVLPTTPADGATDVATDTNLVAVFDEPIMAGSGNIRIRNLATANDMVIPIGDGQVSISGTTLTIDPAVNLDPSDDYAIRIDAGAITDLTGNPFAGIEDDTTWDFTTANDTTAPVIVDLSPADESSLPATGSLVATFDEKIVAVAPAVLLNEDFEGGGGGFTVMTAAGTAWSRGTPDSLSPGVTIDSGNGVASGSGNCWGTNLGTYAGGTGDPGYYADPTITCLRSAPIDLTGATSAQFSFAQAFDLFNPDDEAIVNIIDDTTDTIIAPAVYTVPNGSSGWASSPTIDLSAGIGQMVRIEWCLTGTGGASDDYLGWYVDDVTVAATTGGGITLNNLTDSTETQIALNDPAVAIAGTSLTITPAAALEVGKRYAVRIAADALTDLSGNPFGGILDDSFWNFTVQKTLVSAFDTRADTASTIPLDKTTTTDLAIGPVSSPTSLGRYFRTYLTFDLLGASAATGDATLVLSPAGVENNTSSVPQTFTLFVLDADWNGATQPWPDGTAVATISFTSRTSGDDNRGISFTSAELTTAFNNALGGDLYLGIKSDAEGVDARSFLWLAGAEEPDFTGYEPRLNYTPAAGGSTFAGWIAGKTGVGDQTGLNDDPDGDGIDSGVENFFGTEPGEFSAGLVAGTVNPVAGTFTFTHPQGTLASDLTRRYRWSTDLVTFHDDGATSGGTTVNFSTLPDPPVAGTPTTVTAAVTGTPVPKLFVRVEVTQN